MNILTKSCIMYISIEMGSSYTWCNSTRVTHFLSHKLMRDPMDKNKTTLFITTLNTYLINSLLIKYFLCLFFSLLIKSFFPFSLQFLLRFYFLSQKLLPWTKIKDVKSFHVLLNVFQLYHPVMLLVINLWNCLVFFFFFFFSLLVW